MLLKSCPWPSPAVIPRTRATFIVTNSAIAIYYGLCETRTGNTAPKDFASFVNREDFGRNSAPGILDVLRDRALTSIVDLMGRMTKMTGISEASWPPPATTPTSNYGGSISWSGSNELGALEDVGLNIFQKKLHISTWRIPVATGAIKGHRSQRKVI